MYNQEVKDRFLSEYTGNGSKSVRGRFELLSDAEVLFAKDIAEMTVNEASAAVQRLELIELSSAESALSVIKCYVRWCLENGIFDNADGGFLKLSVSDIDPSRLMSKVLFRDERDFIYAMHKVRNFDELQNDVIALVLGWLGLSIDEALDLRDSDVDFESRKIYNRNGAVIVPWISDELIEILSVYQRTKSAIRQNGTTTYEVVKDLAHDGFIKRVCSASSDKLGTKIPARQIISAIEKMNRQYVSLGFASRFSMTNVQRCGGLHRLWQMEQNGVVIDDKRNARVVEEVCGSKQYRKILWQYKHYKAAFNL